MSGPSPQAPDSLGARLRRHWRTHFSDPRRERLFLSSLGFGAGALTARAITHMIRREIPPFHNITAGGRHLHHLVFGISGLLGTGFTWLVIADTGRTDPHAAPHRIASFVYGTSSALTLDEFALWLNLKDVYWTKQGKVSVEAMMLFGAALSIGAWGGPFLRSAATETVAPH